MAFIILVPVVAVGAVVRKLIFSHTKIEVILVEDLAYIYVNYDKFEAKLNSIDSHLPLRCLSTVLDM